MQFVWLGFLSSSDPVPQSVQQEVNDFLQQPYVPINSAGALRDENGNRAAMLMIFEADNRAAAQALVDNSPYLRAGLYREHHLLQFADEIG